MLWENNEFCIGFNKKAIEEYIEFFTCRQQITGQNKLALFGGDERQNLYDVIYNEPDFRSYVSGKIEEIIKHSETIDIMLHNLTALRYLAKTIYKQKQFKQEEEVRYVYYLDDFNKNIEMILGKPRIKLFPIDHKNMIRMIYIKPQQLAEIPNYRSAAIKMCNFLKISDVKIKCLDSHLNEK